jgi:cytoskeletal protein CcmA (bactofilin family)
MEIPTLINCSSKITGELMFTSDVRIDGEVIGKVESEKSIFIGPRGYVNGFLRTKDLVVFGRIEGNIVVSGITVLQPGSSIFGNLYTKVFEVKDGASITARILTADKLESAVEAQIDRAENMISSLIFKQRPIIPNAQITFHDCPEMVTGAEKMQTIEIEERDEKHVEQPHGSSGDVSPKIADLSIVNFDENKPEKTIWTHIATETTMPKPLPGHEYNPLLEFDFGEIQNHSERLVPEQIPKSATVESFLGVQVKEDVLPYKTGRKKTYKPVTALPSPAARNLKENSIFGIEELMNLISYTKFPDTKKAEKKTKNSQARINSTEPDENETSNNSTIQSGQENSEPLFNDGIGQLPVDDYLSLFK